MTNQLALRIRRHRVLSSAKKPELENTIPAISRGLPARSLRFLFRDRARHCLIATKRPYFTTCRLLSTEKIPGTPLARIPATFLSLSLLTTPSSFTWPAFTIIRIGLFTGIAYLSNDGYP